MNVNTDTVLADLVTEYPTSSRVLLRLGLDFFCGGQQTLAGACRNANLGVEGVIAEMNQALTDDFTPPEGACMTWRTLYARLERFDLELRHHIHLENNVLFPRVLA